MVEEERHILWKGVRVIERHFSVDRCGSACTTTVQHTACAEIDN